MMFFWYTLPTQRSTLSYREGKKLLCFKGKPSMHTNYTATPVASLLERRMPGGKAEGRGL